MLQEYLKLPAVPGEARDSFEEAMNAPEPARADEVRGVAQRIHSLCFQT